MLCFICSSSRQQTHDFFQAVKILSARHAAAAIAKVSW